VRLTFEGRVAIVTGAGRGLGRAHALELGRRGAKVVVNDLGGSVEGLGESFTPARDVAEEIVAAGGHAVANGDSVVTPDGGNAIVECAVENFGRLDILVNNAGVLDMAPLLEASDDHIDRTLATHLRGSFSVTRPALHLMLDQGYGRIVNTSSGAVLGSPVGVAYQSAKAGIIGLTRAVALLGKDSNVKANAVLPTAFTRMTDSIPDPAFRAFMEDRFVPERVAGAVALMCHESFQPSGECFLAGGGRMARLFLGVTPGFISEQGTAEDFAEHLEAVMNAESFIVPLDRGEEFASYLPRLGFAFSATTPLVRET
jgi:NAD(P)-dependent dehydrogenase (short-subunit alcohol dehydrogenase family)